MPVVGLPYALEIMVQQLQAKGTLSSWQIYEEKSGSVCVKVRFDCHDSNQSTMENTLPVTYKRKNEKQIHRDKKRAEIYSQKGMTTRSQTRMSDVEQPRGSLDNLDGETHDLNISDIVTPCSATPVQVETRSPLVHDSPQQTLPNMHMCDPETSPLMDVNKPVTTTTYDMDMSIDMDVIQENRSESGDIPSSGDSSCDDSDKPSASQVCNICKSLLSRCWRTCTHVDHQTPFNICQICYICNGKTHSEHFDQLNLFNGQCDGTQHHCNSCGWIFKNDSKVNKCQKCTSYLLCNNCLKCMKHKGHIPYMVKINADQL